MKIPMMSQLTLCLGAYLLATFGAHADTDTLRSLQNDWAEVQYVLKDKAKETAFETLLKHAKDVIDQHPDDPELLIWSGIIESSYAGFSGGLGALKHAKNAKAYLEHALEIEPNALDGSAYTSLGTLFHKVPGWPIAFGDDDQAEALLKEALIINPNGIDPNYFYAEYLREEGEKEQAKQYYLKALQAPPRPGREVADTGRREEIKQAMQKL